jgi:tripartite-type tricarboxylate transporter receptor subunit TctC
MVSIIRFLSAVFAFVSVVTISNPAQAAYPSKPVTLVSPFGRGGAADMAARALSEAAPEHLGKAISIVYRTGAAGATGSNLVAKSKPDGYTLLLARVGPQATVPAIYRKLPYKWDDFTFLGLLEQNPFVLTVNANSPYQTFDELKKALQKGKRLSYSSAGFGSLLHLGVLVLLDDLGLKPSTLKHIPFHGGGKAATAVVKGDVDILFQNLSGVIGRIQKGKLRALAVTTKERVPLLPNVPTFAQLGYPNMELIVGWSALYGPKNLPEEVTDKWRAVLQSIAKDQSWLITTQSLGSIPMIMNPSNTEEYVKKQYNTFKEVTQRLGLTIE